MLALILTLATWPIAIGSSRLARWPTLAGMTRRPAATSSRMTSGGRASRSATRRIALVMWPDRAKCICVTTFIQTPFAGITRSRFKGCDLSPRRPLAGTPVVGQSRRRGAETPRMTKSERSEHLARLRRGVALWSAVQLLPLFPEREGIEPRRAVHCQDAVQVVDLVLQQLSHPLLELHRVHLALQVLVSQAHLIGARHPHQQVGETKAVVPHLEIVGADVGNLRVHHRPALLVHLDENDAHGGADLRCGHRAAHPVLAFGGAQRVAQVVGDEAGRGGRGVLDPPAADSENWVAQLANAPHGHSPPNLAIWRRAATRDILHPVTIAGVVLAAGRSARMGVPKALLDFRGQPFVIRILEAFEALDLKTTVVVVGPDAPRIRPLLAGHDCLVVENPDVDAGPIASLRRALAVLQPARPAAVLAWPVDLPHVRITTVERLIEGYRRGHPAAGG